jgi:hypothetical protein
MTRSRSRHEFYAAAVGTEGASPTISEVRRMRRALVRRRNLLAIIVVVLFVVVTIAGRVGARIADDRAERVAARITAFASGRTVSETFDDFSSGAFYHWPTGGRMATATLARDGLFRFFVDAQPAWLFWAQRCVVATYHDDGSVTTTVRHRSCP